MSGMFDRDGNFRDPICKPVQGSFRKFELLEDYVTPEITVECERADGSPFTFDLSVPRIFYGFVPPMGPWLAGMCVHDYMYENGIENKKYADKIFKRNLKRGGVKGFLRTIMYHSVRVGGRGAY
jgi:hypothetical protein